MRAIRFFITANLIASFTFAIPVMAQNTVKNTPLPRETVRPVAQDRVQYEEPASQTVHYHAPDPLTAPDEMRIQDMERRIGDLEAELIEIEKRLRETILSVNNLHASLGR